MCIIIFKMNRCQDKYQVCMFISSVIRATAGLWQNAVRGKIVWIASCYDRCKKWHLWQFKSGDITNWLLGTKHRVKCHNSCIRFTCCKTNESIFSSIKSCHPPFIYRSYRLGWNSTWKQEQHRSQTGSKKGKIPREGGIIHIKAAQKYYYFLILFLAKHHVCNKRHISCLQCSSYAK